MKLEDRRSGGKMKKYKAFDGKTISYREWLPKDKPKGLIQIIHGMAEHSGCYDEIGNYLSKEGFAVFCHDQRGHGNTAIEDEDYGFIAEQKGWQLLLEDAKRFNELIKKQFKLPVILYGHRDRKSVV